MHPSNNNIQQINKDVKERQEEERGQECFSPLSGYRRIICAEDILSPEELEACYARAKENERQWREWLRKEGEKERAKKHKKHKFAYTKQQKRIIQEEVRTRAEIKKQYEIKDVENIYPLSGTTKINARFLHQLLSQTEKEKKPDSVNVVDTLVLLVVLELFDKNLLQKEEIEIGKMVIYSVDTKKLAKTLKLTEKVSTAYSLTNKLKKFEKSVFKYVDYAAGTIMFDFTDEFIKSWKDEHHCFVYTYAPALIEYLKDTKEKYEYRWVKIKELMHLTATQQVREVAEGWVAFGIRDTISLSTIIKNIKARSKSAIHRAKKMLENILKTVSDYYVIKLKNDIIYTANAKKIEKLKKAFFQKMQNLPADIIKVSLIQRLRP